MTEFKAIDIVFMKELHYRIACAKISARCTNWFYDIILYVAVYDFDNSSTEWAIINPIRTFIYNGFKPSVIKGIVRDIDDGCVRTSLRQ